MSNNGQWRPAPVGSKENPAPQSHFEAANLGADYKVYQDDAGDRVIEHLPSGTMWKHKTDGTLVTPSVSTENLGNAHVFASAFGSDGAAIQLALDSRGTSPSVVHADVQTTISSPLSVPSNTVVLIEEDITMSDGTEENIFQNKNFSDDATDDENIVFVGDGGTLDGNKANQTVASSDKGNGYGVGAYQNCISLNGITNFRVDGVRLDSPQIHGVNLMAARDGVVSGCVVTNDHFAGIHSHWRQSDTTPNRRVTIEGNVVADGGDNGNESAGLYCSGAIDHVVSDNVVNNRANHGINVAGRAGGTKGVSVVGNTVRDVAATTTYYAEHGAINLVTGTGSGDEIDDVTVANNDIDTTGAANNNQVGVSLLVRGTTISNVSVDGNTIKTQNDGVSIVGNSGRNVDYIAVTSNTITTTTDSDARGVDILDAWFLLVSGNVVQECQASGIAIRASASSSTSTANVTGNAVIGCGQNANASDTYGLWMHDGANCMVYTNALRDRGGNQSHGIYEESTSDSGNVYLLNDCRGNTTAHSLNSGGITDAVNQNQTEDWNIT